MSSGRPGDRPAALSGEDASAWASASVDNAVTARMTCERGPPAGPFPEAPHSAYNAPKRRLKGLRKRLNDD